MASSFKQDNPGCDCCCPECEYINHAWRFRICSETYVDNPNLNSTQNSSNASTIQAIYDKINEIFDLGLFGDFLPYGPYDRSGVNYEGVRASFEFTPPGTGGENIPPSIIVYVSDDCNPFGGADSGSINWDMFYLIVGWEWPVDDPCHPRFYWGIVGLFQSGSKYSWICFSEDIGDGPVEAEISPIFFVPPVLPAASATACDEAPSPSQGYLTKTLYTSFGGCCDNPFTAAPSLRSAHSAGLTPLPLPECGI